MLALGGVSLRRCVVTINYVPYGSGKSHLNSCAKRGCIAFPFYSYRVKGCFDALDRQYVSYSVLFL